MLVHFGARMPGSFRIDAMRRPKLNYSQEDLADGRNIIGFARVEMKGLLVRLDRETLRSPAIEAAFQKLDAQESHGQSST